MKAFKIFKVRKDGSIGPLFINASQRIPLGEWQQARHDIQRKGFAYRPGWHAALSTDGAPHLKCDGVTRAWFEVEVEDFVEYDRPAAQGGSWILAERMKVVRRVP